jgi:ABC-2 type transport system ATP-binding protein
MIRNLRSLGKTVLLTTHYMDEAQSLADRVAIIVGGEIVAEGRPDELTGRDAATRIRVRVPDGELPPPPDLGWTGAHGAGDFEIITDDPTRVLHRLTGWAMDEGIVLQRLTVSSASLEDVYLELTRTERSR